MKFTTKTIFKAGTLLLKFHTGQFRRDGITPYADHCIAVSDRMETEEEVLVALLHDILEDTECTVDDLETAGMPDEVVQAVVAMTRETGDYDYYIETVKANPLARKVKIQDILHNLSDKPTNNQIRKYCKYLPLLLED